MKWSGLKIFGAFLLLIVSLYVLIGFVIPGGGYFINDLGLGGGLEIVFYIPIILVVGAVCFLMG
ncbi:MAG: hypothetical protein WCT41_00410 [Candidatus Paceibacterota bacterium]|jgi:hypothetical protein